jgi:hypothetical protein
MSSIDTTPSTPLPQSTTSPPGMGKGMNGLHTTADKTPQFNAYDAQYPSFGGYDTFNAFGGGQTGFGYNTYGGGAGYPYFRPTAQFVGSADPYYGYNYTPFPEVFNMNGPQLTSRFVENSSQPGSLFGMNEIQPASDASLFTTNGAWFPNSFQANEAQLGYPSTYVSNTFTVNGSTSDCATLSGGGTNASPAISDAFTGNVSSADAPTLSGSGVAASSSVSDASKSSGVAASPSVSDASKSSGVAASPSVSDTFTGNGNCADAASLSGGDRDASPSSDALTGNSSATDAVALSGSGRNASPSLSDVCTGNKNTADAVSLSDSGGNAPPSASNVLTGNGSVADAVSFSVSSPLSSEHQPEQSAINQPHPPSPSQATDSSGLSATTPLDLKINTFKASPDSPLATGTVSEPAPVQPPVSHVFGLDMNPLATGASKKRKPRKPRKKKAAETGKH